MVSKTTKAWFAVVTISAGAFLLAMLTLPTEDPINVNPIHVDTAHRLPSSWSPSPTPPPSPPYGTLALDYEGTYTVGTKPGQVAPGTYQSVVPAAIQCYFAVLAKDGTLVRNSSVLPGAEHIAELIVNPTDYEVQILGNCGHWRKL